MSIQVEIVTPTAIAFSGTATEVQAPGFLGEFGILPSHTQYLSVVKAGVVTIFAEGKETRFIVGRGFAEAGPDRLTLLTELCEDAAGQDKAAAQTLLDESEKTLASADPTSGEALTAARDAELARARLSV
jgi:F-type H+-transporting ATPase subunit epsilon